VTNPFSLLSYRSVIFYIGLLLYFRGILSSLSSRSAIFYIGLLLYFRGMWKSYSRAGGKLNNSKEIDPKIEKVANSSL
jgi:hypothetical protein